MADKTIGSLPAATTVDDDSLFVLEQQGSAVKATGAQWKGYAQSAVSQYVTQAQQQAQASANSATTASQAATDAQAAKTDAETARDGAESAQRAIENLGVAGVTLGAGQQVQVAKTVSETGVVTLTFSIPKGDTGERGDTGNTGPIGPQGISVTNAEVDENGNLILTFSNEQEVNAGSVIGPEGPVGPPGNPGKDVSSIQRTSGTGAPGTTDTYTMYSSDGSVIGTFNVYNGTNGTGSGDFMADGSVPMAGTLQMNGNKIAGVGSPEDDNDGANKKYVDDAISALWQQIQAMNIFIVKEGE